MSFQYTTFRGTVLSSMLERDENKYYWFLVALRNLKNIPGMRTRGEFLEAYYIYNRYVDDICDQDIPLPKGYSSAEEYALEKLDFIRRLDKPRDDADRTLLYSYEIGKSFGQEFHAETDDIVSSMLFDARRTNSFRIFPEEELDYHFHLLDIRGTVKASLKLFGEDPRKYEQLESLGKASRIYYNLRDYKDDFAKGQINVPYEDFFRLGIKRNELEDRMKPGLKVWFREQAQLGQMLLGEHKKEKIDLGILTRITLPLMYERPAERYFKKILT